MLKGKQVILGVCGGIAVYKAAELLRLLVKRGAEVHVIMTRAAQEFVAPLTFQTLSGNPVHTELFNLIAEQEIGHISLADRADLFVVAPATANVIGKIASGIADDMLTTTVMATRAKLLIAPAMNCNMYLNRIYLENEGKLRRLGYHFVDPIKGALACGWEGEGKFQEPSVIVKEALRLLTPQDLAGKKVLVTAGPTREEIDPVRFISNHSSGKMGYAMARAAWQRGAEVFLVTGPTALPEPWGVRTIQISSAGEMRAAVVEHSAECDVIIKAAAVADYRPKARASEKMKKNGDALSINLIRNPDILVELGNNKRPGQILIGFAAETSSVKDHALAKLRAKSLDMIVANDVSAADAGFNVDTNRVQLFFPDGREEALPLADKDEVAMQILDRVVFLAKE